jgi:hypothetical protein
MVLIPGVKRFQNLVLDDWNDLTTSKECWQPSNAGRGRNKFFLETQREPIPANTLILAQ